MTLKCNISLTYIKASYGFSLNKEKNAKEKLPKRRKFIWLT